MAAEEFLGKFKSVDEFTQDNLKKILTATKISNDLPGEKREDYDYYSTFPEFRKIMANQGKKIREMIKSHFAFQGIRGSVSSSQVEDLVDLLTDANDSILERINMNLDEAAGLKREVNPLLIEVSQSNVSRVSGSWNNFDRTKMNKAVENDKGVKLLAAKNVLRPQVKFKEYIDNSDNPFTPRLKEKPNSKKPLSVLVEYDENNAEFFSHPYLFEIERLAVTQSQLTPRPLSLSKPVDCVKVEYIDTKEKLVEMIKTLKQETVIGMDLEAHTYRSYQGIVCLVQISTEHQDYLIDPFDIWGDMTLLNEITTDPRITKVFHGCDSDVVWLQRDFSVYLVNVFDTHQAGKLLGFPRLSLAWLLEHYCKIYADKQYQLADWRIRPLPKEMVYYARQDTRYLVFLYEKLKIELLDKANKQENLLRSAINQSNIICTTRYNKPVLTPESHLNLLKKSKAVLNNKQMFALQELYAWRDSTAKQEDESSNYVVPNHMLLKICSELPREMQGILACCNPVPPLVKQHLHTLHMIILKARNKQLQTVDSDLNRENQGDLEAVQGNENEINENPLKCPHDFSNVESGSGMKTLLNPNTGKLSGFTVISTSGNLLKKCPDLGVYDIKPKERRKPPLQKFVSPFKRFQLVKPYLESLQEPQEPDSQHTKESSEDLRLTSIKLHFQKLTEMTPKPKEVEKSLPEDDEKEDQAEMSDDTDVVPIKRVGYKDIKGLRKEKNDCNPDRDKILEEAEQQTEKRKLDIENKLVQEEINEKKRKKKEKRKSSEPDTFESKIPKKGGFDYENVDFNQMFDRRPSAARKDFHPKQHDEKNNKNPGKRKQKGKNSGKSFSYK